MILEFGLNYGCVKNIACSVLKQPPKHVPRNTLLLEKLFNGVELYVKCDEELVYGGMR